MDEAQKIAEKNNYTLDYLSNGSPIFQVQNKYTFTSDSIHLAHMVKEEKIGTLIDLCAGCGVVGFEVADTKEVKNLYLVELQTDLAVCAKNTANLTKTKTKIVVLNKNVKDITCEMFNFADVVVCNPPYFKAGSGEVSSNPSRAMARHEITLTLEDIIKQTSNLLKNGGSFYLIHILSRENEILKLFKKYNFEVIESKVLDGKLKRAIYNAKLVKK